jgi:hypothetical protein
MANATSRDDPRLGTSTGTKLMVVRLRGRFTPEQRRAENTRSLLSNTAPWARPIKEILGRPRCVLSTSTVTGNTVGPDRTAERTWTNMLLVKQTKQTKSYQFFNKMLQNQLFR